MVISIGRVVPGEAVVIGAGIDLGASTSDRSSLG
jgi:hypothetical protein